MGYHQERKWWGGRITNIFRNRGYSRLSSCGSTEPLLASNNDCCANHQQDIGERKQVSFGDYEEVSQRICEFQRKMDELTRKMDEVKIEVANAKFKNEKRDKTEKENRKRATATLEGEIRKITDQIAVLERKLVNKIKDTKKIAEIEIRNPALEGEIKQLKSRLIYLEATSLNMPVGPDSSAPRLSLDQMGGMERPVSYDELFAWIIILTFFVGFLIGIQI